MHWPRTLFSIALLLVGCASDGQHEITTAGELLLPDGRLREPGWAQRQLLRWDPALVHDATELRQWDFFTVQGDDAAVNVSIVDLWFLQLASVTVTDFATGATHQSMTIADTLSLSGGVEGEATASLEAQEQPAMRLVTTSDGTQVTFSIPRTVFGAASTGSLTLHRRPAMPYLSAATPFREDPFLFFFEQKIPGMTGEGTVTVGDQTWTFTDAAAVMDWGRGAWPSELTWRWAAASGQDIALNLGEGFGDDSAATENLLVVGDQAHKLGRVAWSYTPEDPMAPWTFESDDGRLSLVLDPVAPELGGLELGAKYSRLKKAYGTMSGTLVLEDGRVLEVQGLRGFAEEMQVSW
jgi:hypothetical protein